MKTLWCKLFHRWHWTFTYRIYKHHYTNATVLMRHNLCIKCTRKWTRFVEYYPEEG